MYIRHQSVTFAVIGCISLGLVGLGGASSETRLEPLPLLYADTVPQPQDNDAPDDSSGAGGRVVLRGVEADVYLNPLAAAWRDLRFLIRLSDGLSLR
ncbi:MAG: hypothetical protein JJU32_17765 [Phormidium sp. BM_Day4_Bin.17]|nr:hypothetical protein [Phormidium sp. BM_Day4_Bin.17]UCJ12675.1 MAG: hypothetical protein JWS08_02330 [Phormidium sp. PBR-2020]